MWRMWYLPRVATPHPIATPSITYRQPFLNRYTIATPNRHTRGGAAAPSRMGWIQGRFCKSFRISNTTLWLALLPKRSILGWPGAWRLVLGGHPAGRLLGFRKEVSRFCDSNV